MTETMAMESSVLQHAGNPLQDDPELRRLLQELETISTRSSFQRWRASFLSKLDEYVSVEHRAPAEASYQTFSQSLGKLSALVKKLYLLIQQGQLNKDHTSVRARMCLSDLQGQITTVMQDLENMLPATREQEQKSGFTKFHLGAVLVQDGFCEYDRLVICDEIMQHISQSDLNQICDRQLMDNMLNYHNRLGIFCDVLADLGLYQAMKKCRELMKLEVNEAVIEEEKLSTDEQQGQDVHEVKGEDVSESSDSGSSDSSVSTAETPIPRPPPKKKKEFKPVRTRFAIQVTPSRRHSMGAIPTNFKEESYIWDDDDDSIIELCSLSDTTEDGHAKDTTTKAVRDKDKGKTGRVKKGTSTPKSVSRKQRRASLANDFDSSYAMKPYFSGKKWQSWESPREGTTNFYSFNNYYHGSGDPNEWRIGASLRRANKAKQADQDSDEESIELGPSKEVRQESLFAASAPSIMTSEVSKDSTTSDLNLPLACLGQPEGKEHATCQSFVISDTVKSVVPPMKHVESTPEPTRTQNASVEALGMESAHGTAIARLYRGNASDNENSNDGSATKDDSDSFDSLGESVYPDNKDWGSVLGPVGKDGCPKTYLGMMDSSIHRSTDSMEPPKAVKRQSKKRGKVPSLFQKRHYNKDKLSGTGASEASGSSPSGSVNTDTGANGPTLKSKLSRMFKSPDNKKASKRGVASWAKSLGRKPRVENPSNELNSPAAKEETMLLRPKGDVMKTNDENTFPVCRMDADNIKHPNKSKLSEDVDQKLSRKDERPTNGKANPGDVAPNINGAATVDLSQPVDDEIQFELFNSVSNSVDLANGSIMPGEASIAKSSKTSSPRPKESKKISPNSLKSKSAEKLRRSSLPVSSKEQISPQTVVSSDDIEKTMPVNAPPKNSVSSETSKVAAGGQNNDSAEQQKQNSPQPSTLPEQTLRGEAFGYAVAMSSDGTMYASGAPRHAGDKGRVRIMVCTSEDGDEGSDWTPMGQTLAGKAEGDLFGTAVAMSSDGQIVAVGSPQLSAKKNPGYVRVYKFQPDDNYWAPMGDIIRGKQPGECFGWSVSLSSDGQQIVVGGPQHAQQVGVVRVFKFHGSEKRWVQRGHDVRGQSMGASVASTDNGKLAASSSPNTSRVRAFAVQQ